MDSYLPPDLENLVASYEPSEALTLPFSRQRIIVREMTGLTPNDPDVITSYLSNPDLATLAQDETIWPQLDELYPPEQVEDLLLHAGTPDAMNELLRRRQIEAYDLTNIEKITHFMALLRNDMFPEAHEFFDVLEQAFVDDYEDPEQQQFLLALSSEDLDLLLRYEEEPGGEDTTAMLPVVYYLTGAVEPFLDLMSKLDARSRSIMMFQLDGWQGVVWDFQNPLVLAYIEAYPDTSESEAFRSGDMDVLRRLKHASFHPEDRGW